MTPEEALEALAAVELELALTWETHLSVVRRLQARIDALEREAVKDAQYIASLMYEADERADMDARAYQCGEL